MKNAEVVLGSVVVALLPEVAIAFPDATREVSHFPNT
jgi:hypothetical protein